LAAQINLKVSSNFAQASKDLKNYGQVSEVEAKRIKKFTESFKTEQIDKFIDKNRRAGAAAKATGGDIKSLQVQQSALTRQMESLIKKGLDPQDASIQKLNKEYQRLDKEVRKNADAQKGMEIATKGATAGLIAIGAAVVGAGIGIVKTTIDIGKLGDILAKTSAKVGVGVEALQELSFAAERSGLPANNLSGIFQKLNRNIGDLQAGTGTLTTFLNKSNPALATQLRTVTDSEEAFNILIDQIAKAPTQFEKASLAQAAFGRSGQDIINFANQGSVEIAKLREEARNYGLVSSEVAKLGEDFVDSQRNLKQSITGVKAELAEKLLPTFTDVLNGIADFIKDGDKLKKTLEIVGIALAGVTAGLVTFLLISKGATAIQAIATAFRVLNAAIAANPIGAIAVGITTLLIPAIILLIKNWDTVVVLFSTTIEKLKAQFGLFAANISVVWVTAINDLKMSFIDLGFIILDKVLGSVSKLLELAGKIPFVGDKFKGLQENVDGFANALRISRDEIGKQSEAAINAAKINRDEIKKTTQIALQNIEEQKNARLEALRIQKEANKADIDVINESEVAKTEALKIALSERLAVLNNMEAIAEQERMTTFGGFLAARMEQENITGEERILFLESELERIKALENLSGAERLSAERSIEKSITTEKKRQVSARIALMQLELKAVNTLLTGISDLALAFGGESRKAAAFAKSLAHAQAGINTALAATQTLADPRLPFFAKFAAVAGIIASGVAQQKNIADAKIPTAQTGTPAGGITIPETTSSRTDNVGIVAGPGETVNVSPRGEGGKEFRIIVEIAGQPIIDEVINPGIASGDIRITTDNIQGGAATA